MLPINPTLQPNSKYEAVGGGTLKSNMPSVWMCLKEKGFVHPQRAGFRCSETAVEPKEKQDPLQRSAILIEDTQFIQLENQFLGLGRGGLDLQVRLFDLGVDILQAIRLSPIEI
jgi:hypothetical protein